MSQDDDEAAPSTAHQEQSQATAATSPSSAASDRDTATEHEQDSFEDAVDAVEPPGSPESPDAVDTGSLRSLTKRSASATTSSPSGQAGTAADGNHDAPIAADPVTSGTSSQSQSPRGSSPLSNRISTTSNLDNVNLEDESAPQPEEPLSPAEKNQPNKTLSLSSITNALPNMPWSPPSESPARSPGPSVAPVPSPPVAANPPPPVRKLTSPFSWLSRNSSAKENIPPAASQTTQRRNTASSIATLTSNPEMMLGKLEEENEGQTKDSEVATRTNLKDRFKLLRMREEAGIVPAPVEGDKSGGAVAALARTNSAALGLMSPGAEGFVNDTVTSPAVPTPSGSLAPGTVSGVNAGPSAMPEAQVDWDLWQSVVYEGPAAVARTSAEELNKAIATGIPSAIRGVIWQVLTQSKNDELELTYEELTARGTDRDKDRHSNSTTTSSLSNGGLSVHSGDAVASSSSSTHSANSATHSSTSPKTEKSAEAAIKAQAAATAERKRKDREDAATLKKLEKTIRRDLGARTSYSKYAASAGLQESLFGVCKAYALYDEGVGYAQGMNFLIMPLLFNMPEQEAFCLLVRLMNHYHLRDLFVQDMPGLHMHLYQFERLLEDVEPALYCHLHRRGISPHLYATQWFLTLFAYRFPLQLVLRIYDLILSEGLSAIIRFGIVLMQKNATTLLGISDMAQLTTYLKDKLFDVYIDKDPSQGSLLESGFFGSSSSGIDKEVYKADQLVRDACEVKMTPETLKMYTMEWEEKSKAEKDRETELLDLRTANKKYAIQLRKLEERVELCDREQAGLATELVHTKVENQELKDENESLKSQVAELKVVIEKQPLEIEETWKLERDDLMMRNAKVHEENEKVEKELAELEEQLVQTKMSYAEINSQHETLNRKWSDMKRQFA